MEHKVVTPTGFYAKFIAEGLDYMRNNWAHLDDWEKQWWHSVHERPSHVWTPRMFNHLHQIVEEAKGNIPRRHPRKPTPSPNNGLDRP